MPNTPAARRLTLAANALYTVARRTELSFATLKIAQRAIAARHGYTVDGLRSALAARCGWKFVTCRLYL